MMRNLAFALCLMPFAATAQDLPELPEINELAAPWVDDATPGLAVLVVKEGEVLHFSGFGVADIETGRPVDADTVFDLASVSKQMTALMAARQIEEGLYDSETPVSDFFPAFAAGDEDGVLTVGHLIHHTGGLADYLNEYEGLVATTENPEVVEWLGDQERVLPAGEAFSYSNSGYLLLGSLVAQAGGAGSLGDLLQEEVWGPLGMTSTTLSSAADEETMARGYISTDEGFVLSEEPSAVQGDGNVKTSARDLAAYEAALWGGELLEDTEALFVNGTLADGSPIEDEDGAGYGFGWGLEDSEAGRIAEHSGHGMAPRPTTGAIWIRAFRSSCWPMAKVRVCRALPPT
jgi:CubicO group peptidase (beta-lactamase class C family)